MSFMSVSSASSLTSGSCASSSNSHWSTPITPDYFPDVRQNPLPTNQTKERQESDKCAATPTKASVAAAERVARLQAESVGSLSSSDGHDSSSPSLHEYSSALRSTMRKRYLEAYQKMNRDEGKVVMDFSWEDEDPIDRHVELIKAKAEWQEKRNMEQANANADADAGQSRISLSPKEEVNVMLGRPGLGDEGLPPARPTLLDFKGYSHLSNRSSYRDYPEDGETPGSVCSSGSFEGGSSEDWIDMYGRSKSDLLSNRSLPLDSPSIINRMSQATISSDASSDTITSRDTIIVHRSSTIPTAVGHLQTYPNQTQASTSTGTETNLFQPLPTPAPSSSMANGYFAIPTKSIPVAVNRSYPYPSRPTIGVRQKSRTHPYPAAGRRAISGDLLRIESQLQLAQVQTSTPDEDCGRTDSETMVLRAGLRSQRTRTVARA